MRGFGSKLKQLRLDAGLSQQELAKMIGVTKSVVSYYELSERAPSAEMLVKIAEIFRVSTDHLLGVREDARAVYVHDLLPEDIRLMQEIALILRNKNIKAQNNRKS